MKLYKIFFVLLLSACKTEPTVSSFTGHWAGPEGAALEITETVFGASVVITDLDGPRAFAAKMENGGLSFVRDGKTFTIRPGSGVDTGMKDLVKKDDCLVVAAHEGYCRD